MASRSGLTVKHSIEVGGGVIDPDYTGPIKIILHNFGSTPFSVHPKGRIAQLIIKQYLSPPIKLKSLVPSTSRAEKGFGSSGVNGTPHTTMPSTSHDIIPYEASEVDQNCHTRVSRLRTSLHSCQLQMNFQSPIFTTTVQISKKGKHPTLGLEIKNDDQGPIITLCTPGTPASKVYKWR